MNRAGMGLVALAFVGAIVGAAVLAPLASAREFEGDLASPADGSTVGSYEIKVSGRNVEIEARVTVRASDGMTLEGWLVDVVGGEPAYKLSLGELRGRSLDFEQRMVNVYTYAMLVITVEPRGDLDPNPAEAVAVAILPEPFGQ
jgi:hypothetical protein